MQSVHPEFDPETRTWFVPGRKHEARTLRELRELLGGAAAVQIIGWRPIGTRTPLKAAPPLTADRVLAKSATAKKARRVYKKMIEARQNAAPDPMIVSHGDINRIRALATAAPLVEPALDVAAPITATEPEKAGTLSTADGRRKHFASYPPKRKRNLEWYRSRCTPEQNIALDLWAAGVPGPAISRQLQHRTNATVAAHWLPIARKRGDPRAVIRDKINWGKTKRQPKRGRP